MENIEIINGVPVNWNLFENMSKGNNYQRAKQGYVDFCELLYNNGHKLLSEYTSTNEKVLIDMMCGHSAHWITPSNYKKGKRCPKCYGNCPEQAKENFFNMIEENGHKLLSEYINSDEKVLIDFLCGHSAHWIEPSNYKSGKRCPMCKNKGEGALHNLLLDMGYEVKTQHVYNDLKVERVLKYDFYLPQYNLLIELDGDHHRQEIKYKSNYMTDVERDMADIDAFLRLQDRKHKDKLKDDYAKFNNIPLLRIPYCNGKIELDKWKQFILDKINEIELQIV